MWWTPWGRRQVNRLAVRGGTGLSSPCSCFGRRATNPQCCRRLPGSCSMWLPAAADQGNKRLQAGALTLALPGRGVAASGNVRPVDPPVGMRQRIPRSPPTRVQDSPGPGPLPGRGSSRYPVTRRWRPQLRKFLCVSDYRTCHTHGVSQPPSRTSKQTPDSPAGLVGYSTSPGNTNTHTPGSHLHVTDAGARFIIPPLGDW